MALHTKTARGEGTYIQVIPHDHSFGPHLKMHTYSYNELR